MSCIYRWSVVTYVLAKTFLSLTVPKYHFMIVAIKKVLGVTHTEFLYMMTHSTFGIEILQCNKFKKVT